MSVVDTYGRTWEREIQPDTRIKYTTFGLKLVVDASQDRRVQSIFAGLAPSTPRDERPARITMAELFDRFTGPELNALMARAQANPATLAFIFRNILDDRINLNSNRLENILDALVAGGGLTADRKAEILA